MTNYVGYQNTDRWGSDIWCRHGMQFNDMVKECNNNQACKSFIYADHMNNLGCLKNAKAPRKPHGNVTTYDKE